MYKVQFVLQQCLRSLSVQTFFMPPSMQRRETTSVRERVLAIERSQASENSIIRARYVPDVRGVNRYKHFYVANSLPKQHRPEEEHNKDTNELPQLTLSARSRTQQRVVVDSDDNGVEKGKRCKKQILPQLGSPNTRTKTQKEKDICDYIEQQAKAALTSSDSLSSSTTTRSTLSGRRLHDHLSAAHQQQTPRTFASLGETRNALDRDVFADKPIVVVKEDEASSHSSLARLESERLKIPLQTKETATQTLDDAKNSVLLSPTVESCGEGRSTQTDSYPIIVAPPRRRKSDAPVSMDEIEEREALYQVIEDALGETIDRNSRMRTNQIIANSARKQGQIWRDAKEFIANQLVPQSIQLANKSRSRKKTAVEIVASIKCYP
ncbi:unnamed protein product [Cylicocyclus nassatus]|uniref:Uncharacterized protein n=1 Tax=Cylicocyclus nassatus TaxID=53992 RepID=A0AA36MEG2_CYLNA|nr:unnamed protein product [Cylicocyclus nassatus]